MHGNSMQSDVSFASTTADRCGRSGRFDVSEYQCSALVVLLRVAVVPLHPYGSLQKQRRARPCLLGRWIELQASSQRVAYCYFESFPEACLKVSVLKQFVSFLKECPTKHSRIPNSHVSNRRESRALQEIKYTAIRGSAPEASPCINGVSKSKNRWLFYADLLLRRAGCPY